MAPDSPAKTSQRVSLPIWLTLCALLLLGIALRAQRAGYDTISLDEMWHLAISTGRGSPQMTMPRDVVIENVPAVTSLKGAPPWYSVWANIEEFVHPPLYTQTLRIWRELFGESELTAQWMSVLLSSASIILLWQAARTTFGDGVGLWAAALLALSPTQIYMAQEVRDYTMLQLFGCWALSAAARIEKFGRLRGRMIELSASVLCLMLTHYFAIGACLAIGIWAMLRLRGKNRISAAAVLFASGIVYAIVWGPWMFGHLNAAHAAGETWLADAAAPKTWMTFVRGLVIPFRMIADSSSISPYWAVIGAALIVGGAALCIRKRPDAWLWLLWMLGTIVFITALDAARHTGHLLYVRYTFLCAPGVYVMFAVFLAIFGRVVMHVGMAVASIVAFALLPLAYEPDAPDYKLLQHHLRARAKPGDVFIFYSGNFVAWHNEVLMLAAASAPDLWPKAIVMMSKPADAQLSRSLTGRRVCLISGPLPAAAEQIIPGGQVVEQTVIGADARMQFAICTWIQL